MSSHPRREARHSRDLRLVAGPRWRLYAGRMPEMLKHNLLTGFLRCDDRGRPVHKGADPAVTPHDLYACGPGPIFLMCSQRK